MFNLETHSESPGHPIDLHNMDEQAIRHAFEAWERRHDRIAKGMRHTADGKAILTEDDDWENYLLRFERSAKRLACSNQATIAEIKSRRGTGYKLTALGRDIRALCVNALPLVERKEKGFDLKGRTFLRMDGTMAGIASGEPYTITHVLPNPYITVMLRGCLRLAKTLENYATEEWGNVNEPRIRAAYEHAARFVHRVCRSKAFKTVVKNQERSATDNLNSGLDYVTWLFEKYSKLLVLRVDLYIHPEHHAWSGSDQVEDCLDRYLRALREGRIIKDGIKGYILKREGGFYRGIHYHLMVFLDGHKHQQGYVFSKQLGEAWKERFSDGKGTYFSCWALRKEYEYNALGVVHVSDWIMLTGLRIAIGYMTKENCILKTGKSKNFRHGLKRRLTDAPKPGAPRKAGNDLSILKRIFTVFPTPYL